MKIIERNADTFHASYTPQEKAAAAITLACGHSLGAYYELAADGIYRKASDTIGIYEKTGAVDTMPTEITEPAAHILLHRPDGSILGLVATQRGANSFEPETPSAEKKEIARFIAGMVTPHLTPGSFVARNNTSKLPAIFQQLAEMAQETLGESHPEILHANSVSELMQITLHKAKAGAQNVALYPTGYQVHDIAKICTLPTSMLMPETNQTMANDSAEKAYFGERNRNHPFDFVVLMPFADREIVHSIALHHLSVSSNTKDKTGLPQGGIPELAQYGRIADSFAAMTDHARYPDLNGKPNPMPAVSAEAALEKLFAHAQASSDDIPLAQLGRMVAAGVFDAYVESRKNVDLLKGGVKADETALAEVQQKILAASGKTTVDITREFQDSLKAARVR